MDKKRCEALYILRIWREPSDLAPPGEWRGVLHSPDGRRQGFFKHGLYAEAGAMRIPRAHRLTMAYIQKFGLKTQNFTMDNPRAWVYVGGRKLRLAEANANPDLLGFDVAPHERGQTAGEMWEKAIQPLLDLLATEGEAAWEQIVARYDKYSTREFLERNGWSEGMMEMFGLLMNQEALNRACARRMKSPPAPDV